MQVLDIVRFLLQAHDSLLRLPALRFWLAQLELEYHDLLSLFEPPVCHRCTIRKKGTFACCCSTRRDVQPAAPPAVTISLTAVGQEYLRFLDNGDGEITLMEFVEGAAFPAKLGAVSCCRLWVPKAVRDTFFVSFETSGSLGLPLTTKTIIVVGSHCKAQYIIWYRDSREHKTVGVGILKEIRPNYRGSGFEAAGECQDFGHLASGDEVGGS